MFRARQDAASRVGQVPPSSSHSGVVGEHAGMDNRTDNSNIALKELLLDQITKIQERQEKLDAKIDKILKEQEEFYLSEYKKMDHGFKEVSRCLKEVTGMTEVFKEIIGVMTGERVRFVDHRNENCDDEEALDVNRSELLVENMRRETQRRQANWVRDRIALESRPVSRVKSEFESEQSVEQFLLQRQQEVPMVQSPGGATSRVPPDDFPTYRMNRAIRSVTDLAREYYEGLRGKPSVMSLERRFGSTWRNSSKERTFFHKRMCIINKINDIKDNPTKYGLPSNITRKMAIRVVENMRLGNNCFKGKRCCLTLSQLYVYLSKKMDSPSDYTLELKQVGKTTRELMTQERIRNVGSPSGELTNVSASTNTNEASVSRAATETLPDDAPSQEAYDNMQLADDGDFEEGDENGGNY